MQKPRLTDRTARALSYALDHIESIYADMGGEDYSPEMNADMKRAIEYLEDLLRWKRQKDTHL